MRPHVLRTLQSRSGAIRTAWERLLRLEGVSSPLAHPDALAHLIPTTLSHVFAEAAHPPERALTLREARNMALPSCPCGRNPYLAYFVAGEQALLEAAVLLQAESPPEDRVLSEMAELVRALRLVAFSEIESFCSVCVLRHGSAPGPAQRSAAA